MLNAQMMDASPITTAQHRYPCIQLFLTPETFPSAMTKKNVLGRYLKLTFAVIISK